jgi:excisionase family DNA binding protein
MGMLMHGDHELHASWQQACLGNLVHARGDTARRPEAAHVLGIGRTRVFALIKAGRLQSVKLGSARFITAETLRAFVRELEQEATRQADGEVA